jgi:hypothetical protein
MITSNSSKLLGMSILSTMSSDTPSSEVIAPPSPEEAEKMVKRMSYGAAGLTDPKTGQPLPKDDKVLKIATFSLQKYLKASEQVTDIGASNTFRWT